MLIFFLHTLMKDVLSSQQPKIIKAGLNFENGIRDQCPCVPTGMAIVISVRVCADRYGINDQCPCVPTCLAFMISVRVCADRCGIHDPCPCVPTCNT